jgi:putative flippase GtrA
MLKILKFIDYLIDFARRFPILNRIPVTFYRFVFVGTTTFIIDLIIFRILFDVIKFEANAFNLISFANAISVACAIVYGYTLNKTWSFEDKADNVAAQFGKYALVAVINFSLNNVFFGFFFYRLFMENAIVNRVITSTLSKVFATSFQTISSFIAYKYFVFPKDKEVLSEATVGN